MTVNGVITKAPNSTPATVNSVVGKQYVFVELNCSSATSAITSKTFNSLNQVQGIRLNWITNCSVSVDVGFNGYVITGVVLVPYNSNRVTWLYCSLPRELCRTSQSKNYGYSLNSFCPFQCLFREVGIDVLP